MVTCAVIRGGGGWDVFQNAERLERYRTRLGAVEVAYLLALRHQADGDAAELLVQDEGGELERWQLQSWSGVRSSLHEAALL